MDEDLSEEEEIPIPTNQEDEKKPNEVIPEIPLETNETPPNTEPETPTVETTTFLDEINIGKINFPRDFTQKQNDHKKGVYQVKLVTKENEDIPYFRIYDKNDQLLFEEMAIVIPRKVKYGKFKYRIRKRMVGNEYFMIKVTKPEKQIYAFFLTKK
jgi:hypothetical protein